MEKAKQAVSGFMSKAGHHDTTVHESVAPSVQKETVNEHRREETQVARDREVHQDHYHTTVQPVQHQEVLPEQHHHNVKGVEHRTHDHRDHGAVKDKLQTEAAQFKDSSVRSSAQHSTSAAVPELAGEHVHHHVHEKIQPVVHKETIEPHVVHTTVPVHETIHNKAQHHTSSALPAMSMSEFQNQHGSLGGRDAKTDHFTGEPNAVHIGANQGTGHTGTHRTGDVTGTHGTTGKPSLMDKLNPMKDADGDGKKGIMD
jgi:hypothetical protein